VRSVSSAIEAGFVIRRKSVAVGADFRMGSQELFAGFAEVIVCQAAIYASSGKEEIENEHRAFRVVNNRSISFCF
jgi:hypothetical protein